MPLAVTLYGVNCRADIVHTKDPTVVQKTYLRVDRLAVVSITAKEIQTLSVDAVPGNDSAIHVDWEANI
jgi:hypothetical protein